MSDGRDLLTHSRLQALKTCARKHYLQYELGIRPLKTSAPLRMGDVFHKGKEYLRKGVAPEDALMQALKVYEAVPADIKPCDWAIEREKCFRLLHGYMWYWKDDGLKFVETEKVYTLPIINPDTNRPALKFANGGKIDGIVQLPDGRLAVDETKTAGKDISPESDYWLKLRIDEQVTRYFYSARKLGYDIACIHYDVIRKPTIEPKQIPLLDENNFKIVLDANGQRVMNKNGTPKQSADKEMGWVLQSRIETAQEYGDRLTADIGERPAFYFQRKELQRTDKDLEDFEHDLWQQQQQMSELRRTGRWFKNTGACIGFGRCAYADLCFNGFTGSEPLPPHYAKFDNVNPELDSSDE
ncbi:MAG: PD-(D/E)XK nuclease family protein [Sterolibacterium sp.]